ncbi:TPA: hypothetical protein ACIPBB_003053 [Salmonella enterica subsp. diarizonae serovar 61:l,v:z35]
MSLAPDAGARLSKPMTSREAQMSVNHFIVKIMCRNVEYEHTSVELIASDNEANASQTALLNECRSEVDALNFEDGGVYDLGGEFFYQVKSCQPVPPHDAEIMLRYL